MGHDAGLELLRYVREKSPSIPFVIYAGPGLPYGQQARDAGATEVTASPMVLVEQFRSAGLLG